MCDQFYEHFEKLYSHYHHNINYHPQQLGVIQYEQQNHYNQSVQAQQIASEANQSDHQNIINHQVHYQQSDHHPQ